MVEKTEPLQGKCCVCRQTVKCHKGRSRLGPALIAALHRSGPNNYFCDGTGCVADDLMWTPKEEKKDQ